MAEPNQIGTLLSSLPLGRDGEEVAFVRLPLKEQGRDVRKRPKCLLVLPSSALASAPTGEEELLGRLVENGELKRYKVPPSQSVPGSISLHSTIQFTVRWK